MYNLLKFYGKYDIYQYYVNKTQKMFIEKFLQNLVKEKRNVKFHKLFIEILIKSGVRLSTSNVEPYLELAYYKQSNGIPLTKFELEILNARKIPIANSYMTTEILKHSKFNINDISQNNLFYKIVSLSIDNYGIRLLE